MRLKLFLLLMLAATLPMMAQSAKVPEPNFWLVVWLNDGRKVIKHLSEKPLVKYADDRFTLTADGFTEDYAVDNVRKFTLTDNPSGEDPQGINDIDMSAPVISQFSADALTITGGNPGQQTSVYTVGGILVGSYQADSQGTTIIPLEDLPSGVLIVNSETITYKIIKR